MRRFAYRLALKLGWSNVDAMLRSMTARQYLEWLEFARVEPFGEDRADARAGIIARILANIYRDRGARPTPYDLVDCVPHPAGDAFVGEEGAAAPVRPRQDWREMKAMAMLLSGSGGPNAEWKE